VRHLPILLILALTFSTNMQNSAALPPCDERPTWLEIPVVDSAIFCLERVLENPDLGELAFTALTVAPNDALYAAHPLNGVVYAIEDTDGDRLPDTPTPIIEGLKMPNALAYFDDALYIATESEIIRWQEETEILVGDLPAGSGFGVSSLTVGEDERIYVGIGADCDTCQPTDERGVVLSFDLNGEDRQIVASGFRYPAALAWNEEVLWVTDTARDALQNGRFDEFNRIDLTQRGENYGFPGCIGIENEVDFEGADCSTVISPVFTFQSQSTPLSLAFYNHEAFPSLQDSMLVVLGGSYNDSRLRGYALAAVQLDNNNQSVNILPAIEITNLQYEGNGLYPHRPYGVAISPQGWIYLSVGGGKIYALRPL
jgi:glucose/arabinose dehydrogenase